MPIRSRTFRIFVSSTFADLKAERNALQERVWPKLRDLCMRHGCRFQAIDLRWGVSEEAALYQQALNICLEEIRRCQRVTPRPRSAASSTWKSAPDALGTDPPTRWRSSPL